MLVILTEFRPLRILMGILAFGVLRGAANGDWQAWVILSACILVLWWRDLLIFGGQCRDAASWIVDNTAWAWGKLRDR